MTDPSPVQSATRTTGAHLTDVPSCSDGRWAGRLVDPSDPELDSLAHTPLLDNGVPFKLGPGDQALVAAALAYLDRERPGGEVLVLGVPRGSHDLALCVAVSADLVKRWRSSSSGSGRPARWPGSTVVVGHNTAVQRRLGEVRVRGLYIPGGVADGLNTYRIRGDGRLAAPDGTVTTHQGGSGRLLYLNTRSHWPQLPAERGPLVIIDATRIGRNANVGRAIQWADDHDARHIIVVAHLGDDGPAEELNAFERRTFTFDLAHDLRADLLNELGNGEGDVPLSSNRLFGLPAPGLRVRAVDGGDLAEYVLRGLTALQDAPRRRDSWPFAVARAHRVLAALRRLVDDVENYNRHAVGDPWLPDLGSAARVVEGASELPRPKSRWKTFARTRWGTARFATLEAYRAAEARNPKLDALIDEIDRALRDEDRTVLVRTADRVGASALRETIAHLLGKEALDRVEIARVGEVRSWVSPDDPPVTEILPGAPASWDCSWLHTGESTDRVVLAYPFEVRWIERAAAASAEQLQAKRDLFFRWFGLGAAPRLALDLEMPDAPAPSKYEEVTLSSGDLWERILAVDEPRPESHRNDDRVVRHGSRDSGPALRVRTDDGREHVVPCSHEVEVFVGGKYRVRLAEELKVGDTLLYTTGSGRESLFARLVAAQHRAAGVDELDVVLRRFRDACRRIRADAGSWDEANRRIQAAGASAGTQLRWWASGDTIAPASARDVLVVAKLAGDERLAQNWYRIEAIAVELRSMHQKLGRVLSSAIAEALDGGGPNMRKVTDLAGVRAVEILDEFQSAKVIKIEQE